MLVFQNRKDTKKQNNFLRNISPHLQKPEVVEAKKQMVLQKNIPVDIQRRMVVAQVKQL